MLKLFFGKLCFRLDEQMMVKISDFGLSKLLCKEESYYKLDNKNKELPIRWMSIEAITNGFFNTKSDVVSLK